MAGSLNVDISKFLENASRADIEKKYSSNVMMKMLTEGLHTDITLQACGSRVKAHRYVLAGASTVFQAMFKHGMKEKLTSTVEISDMSTEELQLFLVFLYMSLNEKNDNVPDFEGAVKKHAFGLFQASQKYDVVDRQKQFLSNTLPRILTSDNCWEYGRITSAKHSEGHKLARFVEFVIDGGMSGRPGIDLERPDDVCYKYILDNFDGVVESNSTLEEMKC